MSNPRFSTSSPRASFGFFGWTCVLALVEVTLDIERVYSRGGVFTPGKPGINPQDVFPEGRLVPGCRIVYNDGGKQPMYPSGYRTRFSSDSLKVGKTYWLAISDRGLSGGIFVSAFELVKGK